MKTATLSKYITLTGIALLPFLASAATINWNTASSISGTQDVSLNGDLIYALNFGGIQSGNPIDVTINGVTFQGANNGGKEGVFSTTATNWSRDLTGSTSAPFAQLSGDYRSLLQSYMGKTRSADNTSAFDITLQGLVTGQQYEIQLWVNDSRSRATSASIEILAGNAITLIPNTGGANGGIGQYITGTFTADAITQQISITTNTVDSFAVLNALQLRQIPEANTYALLFAACAAAAVALRRRLR